MIRVGRLGTWIILGTALALPFSRAAGDDGNVSFEQIAPHFSQYCHSCHAGENPRSGIALDGLRSAESVVEDLDLWEQVRDALESSTMPPSDEPQPPPEARAAMVRWLNSELERQDCTLGQDPGHVTIRRLNRTEYTNTIRDLFGVPIRIADQFPADDLGYGFDNIGAVLTVPPLLLERYLDAAEHITDEVLVTTPGPKGVMHPFIAKEMHTRPRNIGRLVDGGQWLNSRGEVFVYFDFPDDGAYVIRFGAVADQAGKDWAKAALRVDDQEVVFSVGPRRGETPGEYQKQLKIKKGRRKVAVAFLNDYYRPDAPESEGRDRNLGIHWITILDPTLRRSPAFPDSHRRIIFEQPNRRNKPEVTRAILERFASRAFRRPATQEEVRQLVDLVALAESRGETWEAGIALAVQAVLVSPSFLFRAELERDPPPGESLVRINDWELASRLSYFLWSSMPDEELLNLARDGRLSDPTILEGQVRRMLVDAKSRALVENFAGQWLQLKNLDRAMPDTRRFKSFNDNLRQAMRTETELFFEVFLREPRSVLDMLDARFTFVNRQLAEHYGLPPVEGDGFVRCELEGTPRAGLLTQASILTITSNPTRTSPVKRGKWILEELLASPPPAPPPGVPELEEPKRGEKKTMSLRQQMELHRDHADCRGCHARMDPLGFALEQFDPIGAYRTEDAGQPIDSSGELPDGTTFSGAAELARILREDRADAFRRCLVQKMLTYALGRGVERSDRCAVDEILEAMKSGDDSLATLIVELVRSEPFQLRRARGEEP